ncbi:uncharacterized protein BROUX77_003942 [Berkeleyomyces rouxiae]|uniref:uncharacterized protein n=1 Tax=Berkeleyomyces rouxiae TaxID=2035830 RepID=UPI003B7DBCB2
MLRHSLAKHHRGATVHFQHLRACQVQALSKALIHNQYSRHFSSLGNDEEFLLPQELEARKRLIKRHNATSQAQIQTSEPSPAQTAPVDEAKVAENATLDDDKPLLGLFDQINTTIVSQLPPATQPTAQSPAVTGSTDAASKPETTTPPRKIFAASSHQPTPSSAASKLSKPGSKPGFTIRSISEDEEFLLPYEIAARKRAKAAEEKAAAEAAKVKAIAEAKALEEDKALAEAREAAEAKARSEAKIAQEVRAKAEARVRAEAEAAEEARLKAEAKARAEAEAVAEAQTVAEERAAAEARRLSAVGTMKPWNPGPSTRPTSGATPQQSTVTSKPLFSISRKATDEEEVFLLPHERAARERLRKTQPSPPRPPQPSATVTSEPNSASSSAPPVASSILSTTKLSPSAPSLLPKSTFTIRNVKGDDDFLLPSEMAARERLRKSIESASLPSTATGTPTGKLQASQNSLGSQNNRETSQNLQFERERSTSDPVAGLYSHLNNLSRKNTSTKPGQNEHPQSQISKFSNLLNNLHSQRQKMESSGNNGTAKEPSTSQASGSWSLLMRKRGREQGQGQRQDRNQPQFSRRNQQPLSNSNQKAHSIGLPENYAYHENDLPKNYASNQDSGVSKNDNRQQKVGQNQKPSGIEAFGIEVDTSPVDVIPETQPGDTRKKGRKGRHQVEEEEEDEEFKNERHPKKQDKNKKKRNEMDYEKRAGRSSRSHYGEDDPDEKAWSAEDEWLFEERRRRKAERKAEKEAAKKAALDAKANKVKTIHLPEFINVSSLAQALEVKVQEFLDILLEYGFEDMTEDTIMTGETAALIAQEFGLEAVIDDGQARDVRPRPPPEDPSVLLPRPPVVTIMGHVDHGKTTLLDWLRKSSIAAQEHGGITQHIGAFVVKMPSGKQITFLDTPGHAAFLSMRQRGANATDIVILVVAADDSVMPQTLEALKHAREAKVPIIVAITKCDKPDARIDAVKNDLSRHDVDIEDYGGDVQVVPVSGKTGEGMDLLEENIITLAEMIDMRAEIDGMAEGWVLEANIKTVGKAATVLVKRGTLRVGDCIVAGHTWARVRALRDESGADIQEAGPGTPVEILGWKDLPQAGDQLIQAPDEAKARGAISYRTEMKEREAGQNQLADSERKKKEAIAAEEAKKAAEESGEASEEVEKGPKIVNFIIRGDVVGSVEAVSATVLEIGSHEVQPRILRQAAGNVSESDIEYAAVSGSVIISFNNPSSGLVKRLASDQGVRIVEHSVIYTVADNVKAILSEKLEDKVSYRVIGEAEVSKIFSINIKRRIFKNIAGCKVRNGTFKRNDYVRIFRKGELVHEGKMSELKQGKRDVMEMRVGTECGVSFEDFQEFETGDIIQTCEEVRTKRTL